MQALSPNLEPTEIFLLDDPMPNWRWKGRIVPNASLLSQKVDWSKLVLEEVNLPNGASIPAKAAFFGGRNLYFPDFNDVPAVQVTIYENEFGDAARELQKWRNMIMRRVGPESIYGLPTQYQQTLHVDLFGFADNVTPTMSVDVADVWPTEPGTWRLAYDSTGRLMHVVTLQCNEINTANRSGGPST